MTSIIGQCGVMKDGFCIFAAVTKGAGADRTFIELIFFEWRFSCFFWDIIISPCFFKHFFSTVTQRMLHSG
jgi:hypothetical protein